MPWFLHKNHLFLWQMVLRNELKISFFDKISSWFQGNRILRQGACACKKAFNTCNFHLWRVFFSLRSWRKTFCGNVFSTVFANFVSSTQRITKTLLFQRPCYLVSSLVLIQLKQISRNSFAEKNIRRVFCLNGFSAKSMLIVDKFYH